MHACPGMVSGGARGRRLRVLKFGGRQGVANQDVFRSLVHRAGHTCKHGRLETGTKLLHDALGVDLQG
eukprot:1157957-Pelagomonas_calceolata.AAC.12